MSDNPGVSPQPEPEHHSMTMVRLHSGGIEEWVCDVCGRWLLIRWPPFYQKVVIEEGDVTVSHSGGEGGISMGGAEVQEQPPADPEEERRLQPWADFMRKIGDG